jgi:metal-responsive CopG/Arc/MetJ family transcriptional regulator
VSKTNSEENGRTDMTSVKVPKALMERIEALLAARGYVSRSEYVRTAIQKQLAQDEGRTEGKT